VPIDQQHLQEVIDRVFAGQPALEACRRRDLGALIRLLRKYGITQGAIAARTGIAQGRLSNYNTGKHIPMAAHIFEEFADGLNIPVQARRALGLAPATARAPPSPIRSVSLPTHSISRPSRRRSVERGRG
jgi:transcriptional regulator with XRE-family HTH domain